MRTAATIGLASLLAMTGQVSAEEFSGSVAFTTDYVFRGISQTDEEPAVQGSLDYSQESGLYAGVWGSPVDFDDGDEAHVEIDYYAGLRNSLAAGLNYDVGFIYFSYPGADEDLDYNFWEVTGALSTTFEPFELEARVNYSPEFFGDSGDAFYYQLYGSIPMDPFTLSLKIARQTVDDNASFGADDYTDWSAALFYRLQGFDFGIEFTDTSLDDNECFGGTELCDARLVLSASRSF